MEKGKIRGQLDHFYSKSKYPLLSNSIFNLIPACDNCNKGFKGVTEFTLDKNLHPYFNGVNSLKTFSPKIDNLDKERAILNDLKVEIAKDLKDNVKNNLTVFGIIERYNTDDTKKEILEICKFTRKYGISTINYYLSLPHFKTVEDIICTNFGINFDSSKFHKDRLSKLKYDAYVEHIKDVLLDEFDFIEIID